MNIIKDFLVFVRNNNIMSTIIATVLSTYITEFTTSFTDDIILPIIYRDGDKNGKADIDKLKELKLKVSGITFKIGKFILICIKLIIVLISIFFISKISSKNII